MDQEKINADYKIFKIPTESIPVYEGPKFFAETLQKFTLLKDVNTVYTDISPCYETPQG
jgi:hypothetical protein